MSHEATERDHAIFHLFLCLYYTLSKLRKRDSGRCPAENELKRKRGPMPHCAHCDQEFTPKNVRGRFCSSKCRAAAWQRKRHDELGQVEEQLTRAVTRVRALWGSKTAA
jgi:hypothetical protein